MTRKKGIELLIIFHAVGLAGFAIPAIRPCFEYLIPVNLLVSIGIVFYFHKPKTTQFWIVCTLIFMLGYALEAIGVNTGYLFGNYGYGTNLGPKVLQTPLIIGVNWLMLIYCIYNLINKIALPWRINCLVGSVLMVGFDFIMEPVAVNLNMWEWENDIIPLNNYITWFLSSYLLLSLLYVFRITGKNNVAVWLFGLQVMFFILLRLILF